MRRLSATLFALAVASVSWAGVYPLGGPGAMYASGGGGGGGLQVEDWQVTEESSTSSTTTSFDTDTLGLVVGEYLILCASSDGFTTGWGDPTGGSGNTWTQFIDGEAPGGSAALLCWGRDVAASDPGATFSVTHTSADPSVGYAIRVSGQGATQDGSTHVEDAGNTSSPTHDSLTVTAGSLVFFMTSVDSPADGRTVTCPTGFTLNTDCIVTTPTFGAHGADSGIAWEIAGSTSSSTPQWTFSAADGTRNAEWEIKE